VKVKQYNIPEEWNERKKKLMISNRCIKCTMKKPLKANEEYKGNFQPHKEHLSKNSQNYTLSWRLRQEDDVFKGYTASSTET
jgi:hypothetical protein